MSDRDEMDALEAAQAAADEELAMQADARAAFNAALARAQAKMANPAFDGSNPHFRSKFASLAAVRNAVVPVLAAEGIACVQELRTTDRGVSCLTTLAHASGWQQEFGPLEIPATKPDAQGFGSAATYARRYALMAIAGVVGDEDDDANAATGKPAPPAKPGIGKHSPLGDVDVTDDARAYAEAFVTALTEGTAETVREVHLDVKQAGEDVYRATWSLLDSRQRSSIKKLIAEAA